MKAQILGTGMAVPDNRLTNADLEQMVDTSDEWILTRTGIRERPLASEEEATSSFALPAVERALEMAGVDGAQVDLVICATVSPDMPFPAVASLIQHRIGAGHVPAFDISAGCSGFVYALGIASQFIENGTARTAVVVGSEVLSKFVDWEDRSTCVLFGDGAGAVVLQATDEERGVLATSLHSDGSLYTMLCMPGGGSLHPPCKDFGDSKLPYIKMRGNETFKIAVRTLADVSYEVLAKCGLHHSQVNWFIPHQANLRIIKAVGQRLEIPNGHTYVNVDRFGNTSAASIPIALDELNRAGKLAPEDVVLFSAFGAGLTWGAAVVRW